MRAILLGLVLCVACGDNAGHPVDASPHDVLGLVDAPPDGNPLTPDTLAETGLCANPACDQVMPGVMAYTPQYALWSDTATKRRWIYLPPGTQIDTADMNFWKFPVGTKLWKEFTRDNVRVETRYLVKLLDDDAAAQGWYYVTYQWNLAQDATTAVVAGVMNANGTEHDIPSRAFCRQCHEGVRTRVLGFGAIALDYQAAAGDVDLDDLIALNLLTVVPAGTTGSPRFPLPGTVAQQAALGYLHVNCGHCHNPTGPIHDQTPLELRLDTTRLATVDATPAYTTTVNVAGMAVNDGGTLHSGNLITPQDAANSLLRIRFNATPGTAIHMPARGSEMIDPTGVSLIDDFIGSL